MPAKRVLPDSFHSALDIARKILSANPAIVSGGTVETEAEQILLRSLELIQGRAVSRIDLFSRMNEKLPLGVESKVLEFSKARASGQVLQYVLGVQTFMGHQYSVGPGVLVPRPETEVLVCKALEVLSKQKPCFGLEIGIGSGIISIELLERFPKLVMLASELTEQAEKYANENAGRILDSKQDSKDRLHVFRQTDPLMVLNGFKEQIAVSGRQADFLISNPPYLEKNDEIARDVLENEPVEALFSASGEPLYFYVQIAKEAAPLLVQGGHLFLEIPHLRSAIISDIFLEQNWTIELSKDLTGRDRVLVATQYARQQRHLS